MTDAYSMTNSRGTVYFLHCKDITLRNGVKQRIYYFAKEVRDGYLMALPEGMVARESARTGMLFLKKGTN